MVVTLDPLTTGFSYDLQLIIQLSIDKCAYKVKTAVRSVQDFAAIALVQSSLSDLILNENNSRQNLMTKVSLLLSDTVLMAY